jgi:predicted AlkP superfamily phosphohydrolase/phosphomutase
MDRLVVLGLDGFHEDLLRYTPTVREFYESNPGTRLESVEPPVTAPAWASFQTGKNQGKHGIYDFVSYDEDLEMRFLTGADLQAKTFYEYLIEAGLDIFLYNLPFALPSRSTADVMPSWLDSDSTPAPEDLYDQYGVEPPKFPDLSNSRLRNIKVMETCLDHNAKQFKTVLREGDHEFLFHLVSVTDWLQHAAYLDLFEEGDPDVAEAGEGLLASVDEYVADINAALGPDDGLLLMSDHGFKRYEGSFYVNDWLEREGWLITGSEHIGDKNERGKRSVDIGTVGRFLARKEFLRPLLRRAKYFLQDRTNLQFSLDAGIDPEKSVAYCLSKDESAIRIQSPDTDKETLSREIVAALNEEPGVDAVLGADLYNGPLVDEGGEVIVISNQFKAKRGPIGSIRINESLGHHSKYGIVAADIPKIERNPGLNDANILDLAPTILTRSDEAVQNDRHATDLDSLVEYG